MATNNQIKFYKSASAPANPSLGLIWFNTTNRTINVYVGGETLWEKYAGLVDASWASDTRTLVITNAKGENIEIKDLASASAISTELNKLDTAVKAAQNTADGAATAAANAQSHSEGVASNLANEVKTRGEEITRVEGLISDEAQTARAAEQANAKAASDAATLAQKGVDDAAAAALAVETEKGRAEGVESGLDTRLKAIEDKFGSGEGSVDDLISNAIADLDATVGTQTIESGKHVAVEVVETDGKLTGVTVTENFDDITKAISDEAALARENEGALGDRITNEAPVTMAETAGTGDILKTYTFTQNGREIGKINLAKDLVVSGGQVVEKEGVKYLQLTIANQSEPVEIAVSDLVDVYTGSDFVSISDANVISVDKAGIIAGLATETYVDSKISAEVERANGAYDEKGAAAAAQSAAQAYADGLASNYATAAQGAKADTAIQNGVSGTYVSVSKEGTNLKVSETVQPVSTASDSAKGLAEASDVKSYVDAQVGGKNVSAEGDAYVSATASGNKVTVAATDSTKASLALADSSVQKVETGATNGTIKVDGTEVAVAGLKSAAYVETTAFDAAGSASAAEAAAKAHADNLMCWVEFE